VVGVYRAPRIFWERAKRATPLYGTLACTVLQYVLYVRTAGSVGKCGGRRGGVYRGRGCTMMETTPHGTALSHAPADHPYPSHLPHGMLFAAQDVAGGGSWTRGRSPPYNPPLYTMRYGTVRTVQYLRGWVQGGGAAVGGWRGWAGEVERGLAVWVAVGRVEWWDPVEQSR